MTAYACGNVCGWTYDTVNHTEDEMPPQSVETLPDGALPLRSSLVTVLYCPTCLHRRLQEVRFANVPFAVPE